MEHYRTTMLTGFARNFLRVGVKRKNRNCDGYAEAKDGVGGASVIAEIVDQNRQAGPAGSSSASTCSRSQLFNLNAVRDGAVRFKNYAHPVSARHFVTHGKAMSGRDPFDDLLELARLNRCAAQPNVEFFDLLSPRSCTRPARFDQRTLRRFLGGGSRHFFGNLVDLGGTQAGRPGAPAARKRQKYNRQADGGQDPEILTRKYSECAV